MHLPQLGNKGSYLIQKMNDKLVEHKQYIAEYGQIWRRIRNWSGTDQILIRFEQVVLNGLI